MASELIPASAALLERSHALSVDCDLAASDGQLSVLIGELQAVGQQAKRLVAGYEPADLQCQWGGESWSVAECLEHLALTTRAFIPAIEEAIAAAPALKKRRRLRTGVLARMLIRNLEPPYRVRLKVLPTLVPRPKDFGSAWQSFEQSQNQLLATARAASGLAIDRVKIQSPVYARIRYNVYGALRMLVAHERRHLWQIQEILKRRDRALTSLD